jgi:hypothetical protein
MAGEREHILEVLHLLETRLTSARRTADAGRIGVIRHAVASSRHLDAALETLSGVRGFRDFSLRLMWYAEKGRDPFASPSTAATASLRADELLSLLPPASEEAAASSPAEPRTIAAAVEDFGGAIEAMKRGSMEGGRFTGITGELAGRVRAEARPLAQAAGLEEDRDVARFAEAVERFLDLVAMRSLSGDVRVVNLLDSANITLQTALQTHAAEDYDSLQEITRLLENPLPLFEPPPPPEHE